MSVEIGIELVPPQAYPNAKAKRAPAMVRRNTKASSSARSGLRAGAVAQRSVERNHAPLYDPSGITHASYHAVHREVHRAAIHHGLGLPHRCDLLHYAPAG